MSVVESTRRHTPEDLLTMPGGKHYELVNGELVETTMGAKASWTASVLTHLLMSFVLPRRLGWVFNAEMGYQCFGDDGADVRRPDVSFVSMGRFPGEQPPEGHLRIPPDLAAESVSPGDTYYEIERKCGDYLKAGVRLIWIMNPDTRTVRVLRPERPAREPNRTEILSGEDVLPGFSCPVAQLFAMPGQTDSVAPSR
jgi:Uma2 family endonuclease